jgi:hypothetical protein
MQIYEIIANLFILSVSLCLLTMAAFFFFVTGDVTLERFVDDEKVRYVIIVSTLLVAVILILM